MEITKSFDQHFWPKIITIFHKNKIHSLHLQKTRRTFLFGLFSLLLLTKKFLTSQSFMSVICRIDNFFFGETYVHNRTDATNMYKIITIQTF